MKFVYFVWKTDIKQILEETLCILNTAGDVFGYNIPTMDL